MSKLVQLVVSCVVLGTGVALLLEAALGSDGYSTLVNGLSLSTGQPFWVVNFLVGVALILMAWTRLGGKGPSGTPPEGPPLWISRSATPGSGD